MASYNTGVHEKNELPNYRPSVVGGFYVFVFYRASLVHQEMLFLIIGGTMDITLIRKAIALIAKGIMEKDNPEIFDYNIPQRLRDVYAQKDYGRWTDETGEVPVCFIATNHTTGGNSGSPVINADGDLIGLNFDRVWEGTMSDIVFDPEICRNISLDVRYVLFTIEKIGGASYLFDEMVFAE